MNHLGTIVLETERLILRRFTVDDTEEMFNNWANDPNVCKYMTWSPHQNKEITKIILELWVENYKQANNYQWAIVHKENNELFGSIGVVVIDEEIEEIEIGYCSAKKYWHQGYMSEAFKRIIKFFFEEVGVNRIMGSHHIDNVNSGHVMLSCGLKYEGLHRQKRKYNNGQYCDIKSYAILKEDYIKEGE